VDCDLRTSANVDAEFHFGSNFNSSKSLDPREEAPHCTGSLHGLATTTLDCGGRMKMLRAGAMLAVALVGLLLACPTDAAAILGIDFGTSLIKVSFVQPGKAFDIVLTADSKRMAANVVGFKRGERLFSTDAINLAGREPEHVFVRTRDLLGVTRDSEEIRHLETLGLPYELRDDPDTGGFKVVMDPNTGKEQAFHPEELVAMILSFVRSMSKNYIESDVKDCVITVPPFFSQSQREALLNAAEIAGLNVLSLVDENIAAAVQHGVYNEFANSSHKVLLYNMGSASTKATLLNFYGKPGATKNSKLTTHVEVLAKAWDRTLGGDSFDMLMLNMIADAYDKEHGKNDNSVRDSRRAMQRIRAQANKVKTVLSANPEFPVRIESLSDGNDLRMHATRDEFEKAASDLLQRVTAPIEKVLTETGTKVEDLHAVELIGGSIRIPRIKDILTDYLKPHELGSHLNGDESKTFGAVFMGANMSKAFRVRPVGLRDITMSSVDLELTNLDGSPGEDGEEWKKDTLLFERTHALNAKKVVSFKHDKDVICTLYRTPGDSEDGREAVAEYEISDVNAATEQFGKFGKPKISLGFLISHNDTVLITKAEAIFVEEIPAEEDDEEEKVDEDENASTSETETEGGDSEGEEKAKGDDSDEEKSSSPEDGESEGEATEEKDSSQDTDSSSKETKKKKKGPTKRTHRYTLTIKRTDKPVKLKQLNAEQIAEARALLNSFEEKEQERRLHESAKNSLESFIFSSRDKVRSQEERVDLVISEAEKNQFFEDFMALEDWLEDVSEDAPLAEFEEKRQEIDKRVKKIFRLVREIDQRPATIRAAEKVVATAREQIEKVWPKERPWISAEEIEHVKSIINSFEEWLNQKVAEQESISLQDPPVISSTDVASRLEAIHDVFEHAMRRPFPKPPKKPKKKETREDEDNAGKDQEQEENGEKDQEQEENDEKGQPPDQDQDSDPSSEQEEDSNTDAKDEL